MHFTSIEIGLCTRTTNEITFAVPTFTTNASAENWIARTLLKESTQCNMDMSICLCLKLKHRWAVMFTFCFTLATSKIAMNTKQDMHRIKFQLSGPNSTNGRKTTQKKYKRPENTWSCYRRDTGLLCIFLRFVAINYKLKTTVLLSIFNSLHFFSALMVIFSWYFFLSFFFLFSHSICCLVQHTHAHTYIRTTGYVSIQCK